VVSPEEQRRAWAYRWVSRCHEPPVGYGTPEWLALPDGSPEKLAAVILAAERCVLDLEAAKALEDQVWGERKAEHRAAWTDHGFRPDPRLAAEIEREWREWVGGAA